MSSHTVTANSISVHGRGSLSLLFKLNNAQGQQINLAGRPIFFEVERVIREPLVPDLIDTMAMRIVLERSQIELLGSTPLKFAVIDESSAGSDLYEILWQGTISTTGFRGEPEGENV